MSKPATLHSNPSPAFPFERYEGKCGRCVPPLKIVFGIIGALEIVLALAGYYAPLDQTFVYLGASLSGVALIVVGVLFITQKNTLRAALNDVRSFADLKAIIDTTAAQEEYDCCCCLKSDTDLVITSNRLGGTINSGELHTKIENMLKRPKVPFDAAEKLSAQQITEYLDTKYRELHSNETTPDIRKYIV